MILDEYREKRIKRVTNMTLAQARDLIAKTLDHSDMELEFDKAVWMLLNCADEKINGGWVSVTERLPEENERILLNIRMPHYQAVRSGMYHDELFSLDNGDCWRVGDIEVVAWQSLPEPYKTESENT